MAEVLERRLLASTYFWLNGPGTEIPEGAAIEYSVGWFWDNGGSPGGTVTIDYSGSAAGGDCETPVTSITIPPNPYGHQSPGTATFLVQIKRDNEVEDTPEELTVTLSSNSPGLVRGTYGYPPFLDPTPLVARTMTIKDDPPIVSIAALDADAEESAEDETPNPGSVRVTRSGGNINDALPVVLTTGGTATEGEDYELGSATIPAGASSAVVQLTVLDDPDAEGIETADILVAPNMPHYRQADPNAKFPVRLRIDDNISVRSVRVEVRGAVQNSVRGYAFDVRVVVSGEHLDLAEMHQNVKSSSSVWDFNGNPLAPAAVMGFFQGSDPNVIDSNGQWLQDTGWGWGPLNIVANTNNGLGLGDDRQQTWLGNPAAAFWNVAFVSRYYQFQVRNARTDAILNTTEWGYKWSNWNCAWTAANGAPVALCASPNITPAGLFSDIETISGLP